MTGYWAPVVFVGLAAGIVIGLCVGLTARDSACIATGGSVKVVVEHQAKGDMNHTICISIPQR